MPDQQVKVNIGADASQLIETYKRIAQAQIEVNTTATAIRNTMNALASGELPKVDAVVNQLAADKMKLAEQTKVLKAAQAELPPVIERTTNSLQNQRYAAQLAARDLGIAMPRALSSIAAQSSILGPILASAFPVVGAIAFFEVLERVPEMFQKIIDKAAGLTAELKKIEALVHGENIGIIDQQTQYAIALAHVSEAGKTGEALRSERLKNDEKEVAILRQKEEALKNQIAPLERLHALDQGPGNVTAYEDKDGRLHIGGGSLLGDNSSADNGRSKEQKESTNKELEESKKALEAVQQAIKEKQNIGIPQDSAKEQTSAMKDQMKRFEEELDQQKRTHLLSKEEEAAFWESKLEIVKRGTDEYHEILAKVATYDQGVFRDQEELQKKNVELTKKYNDDANAESQIFAHQQEQEAHKELEVYNKRVLEKVKALSDAAAIEKQSQLAASEDALKDQETAAKNRLALGESSALGELNQLKKIHQQEYDLKMQAMNEQLNNAQNIDPNIDPSAPAKVAAIQAQILQIQRDYNRQRVADNQQTAMLMTQQFRSMLTNITGDFNQNFIQWANGSQKWSTAMAHTWTSFADGAISDLMKLGEHYLIEHVIMAQVDKIFHAQQIANQTASVVAGKTLAQAQVATDAGVGAAGAAAATAAIPIVGPELAPAAGASMLSIIEGFGQFEKGGLVPATGFAKLHEGERVLTKSEVENGQRGSATTGGKDGASRPITLNYHAHVQTLSAAGMKDAMNQHGEMVAAHLTKILRQKGVRI